ncbi:hypothetical protein [Mycoplasma suis]|nr:hypothetical protein [Mycoplasma suis]
MFPLAKISSLVAAVAGALGISSYFATYKLYSHLGGAIPKII